jgi:hypothetical protein
MAQTWSGIYPEAEPHRRRKVSALALAVSVVASFGITQFHVLAGGLLCTAVVADQATGRWKCTRWQLPAMGA